MARFDDGSHVGQSSDLSEAVASLNLSSPEPNLDDQALERPRDVIIQYLTENVEEFSRLSVLRKKGWENPAGDTFFRKQRDTADNADEKTRQAFFNMMMGIAQHLHSHTRALKIRNPGPGRQRILDMCMAPGGFLSVALEKNPDAHALCFSLPASQGGHRVLLQPSPNVELRYMDITMLAEDMGVVGIPAGHPDSDNFVPRQLQSDDLFHLVFCDGQVLRPHEKFRASYREQCEARRLTATQLALGLEHLRPGGTMIVLLHKVEAWDTVLRLREFSRFSHVRLFKPGRAHAKRSSFYMIARNVRSQSAEALAAIGSWKEVWRAATFDVLEEKPPGHWRAEGPDPHDVIGDFGDELVRLGTQVWKIQADALEQSTFIKGYKA
ncbi:hypothetical protein LX36DRAFT_567487 [Colletotrichum falcatum]|nr:hypothetical protein LX36DRAFT_567487 [Colletotrichum falcatum]